MVLLEKLWDDIVDRSDTNNRIAGLRGGSISTSPPLIISGKYKRNKSVPAGWSAAVKTCTAATTPVSKDSTDWGSCVFYPGLENHSAATSAALRLHPAGDFFNITDQPCTAGLWSEEAKGKQPMAT